MAVNYKPLRIQLAKRTKKTYVIVMAWITTSVIA